MLHGIMLLSVAIPGNEHIIINRTVHIKTAVLELSMQSNHFYCILLYFIIPANNVSGNVIVPSGVTHGI
jgi:formate/nitrite transporter FocA (FNT family)